MASNLKTIVMSFLPLLCIFLVLGFGKAEEGVGIYTLKRGDFTIQLTNFGATVLSVLVPDRVGNMADIVLGYETLHEYKNDTTNFGALIGRVANRIGGAEFELDGKVYKLPANDGNNTLHGGPKGFRNVIWRVRSYDSSSHVTFTYNSFDGEEGFPGDLAVSVTYTLLKNHGFAIKMEAKPLNKRTPVNLASHTYWNLGGHNSGDIFSHNIQIFGSKITPVRSDLIPTGEINLVEGTAYDFLKPHAIGSRFNEVPGGYDINYVLDVNGNGKHLTKAAVVSHSKTGRKMEIWTNQLGVQFYTSNMLSNATGKGGYVYQKYAGLCLETQGFPDSVNHPNFPSQIVNPTETYRHIMVYRFTAT